MNKASEWAAAYEQVERDYRRYEATRLEWLCPSGGAHAIVKTNGELWIHVSDHNSVHMTTDDAISLGKWLLDTFLEPGQ